MSSHKDFGDAVVLHDAERAAEDDPTTRECGPPLAGEERDAMLRSLADAHRQIAELHRPVLRIAGNQQRLRPIVLGPGVQNFSASAQHDPAEPAPILVPAIDDNGGLRVLQDVAQPLQRPVLAFRLLVDRDVKRIVPLGICGHRIAHGYHMRRAAGLRRRQMADPAAVEKITVAPAEHAPILRQRAPVAYPFRARIR